jgi:cytochrome P450
MNHRGAAQLPSRFGGVNNLTRFARNPMRFLQDCSELGDTVTARMMPGGARWVLLFHPSDVETMLVAHAGDVGRDEYSHVLKRALGEGLLTSDGELWKRQRRLSSSAFTPKRIRGYATQMASVTDAGLGRWRAGEAINLHEELSRLTMEVVADVLFGAGVASEDVTTVRESMEVFNAYFGRSFEVVLRIPTWVPTPLHRRLGHANERIDALIARIVESRRRGGAVRDDLLGALLAATDDDGSKMDDRQLRDEVVTLFLAGHETTALALTHSLYLLGKHPDVERRVAAEIASVLGGRVPTADDVPRLSYTECVIKESMRLYPPAWVTGREVTKPFSIGGADLVVGDQVMVSQWIVHRDPRWFPSPEAFDPDRFTPEASAGRPRFAYFPFGGGPRVCIGNHFAMMEAVLMLAMIVARFRVELLPFEDLRFSPSVTLRPKGRGVRARLATRARPAAPAVAVS